MAENVIPANPGFELLVVRLPNPREFERRLIDPATHSLWSETRREPIVGWRIDNFGYVAVVTPLLAIDPKIQESGIHNGIMYPDERVRSCSDIYEDPDKFIEAVRKSWLESLQGSGGAGGA